VVRRALAAAALALALGSHARAAEPELQVRVRVDREEVVLHEQLLLSVEVIHPADARASWEAPPFDGFWAERLGTRALPEDPSGLHRTEFRRALFPTRTGELEVAPSKLQVEGASGALHDVAVPGARVRVQPLPDGVPADAVVGKLEVHVSSADERVRLGKSLALAIELAGDANVWDAAPPNVEALVGPDVEVFPEPAHVSIAESAGRAFARRTFRYALVPARAGALRLAALAIPYFDPATRKLESARSDAQTFDVFVGPSKEESSASAARVRHPTVSPAPAWPLWTGGALAAAALAWVVVRSRRSGLAGLVAAGGPSPAAALEAARAARGTGEFAALLARAVRAGVQARHHFDALSLTSEEIAARGAEREAVELLEALDRARFARRSADEEALFERARAYLSL
jgi:hypothetical protein